MLLGEALAVWIEVDSINNVLQLRMKMPIESFILELVGTVEELFGLVEGKHGYELDSSCKESNWWTFWLLLRSNIVLIDIEAVIRWRVSIPQHE